MPERPELHQRRREDESAAGATLLTKVLMFILCVAMLVDWMLAWLAR